jgi:general stress protein 26
MHIMKEKTMDLSELFKGNGFGVMATSGADGGVNTAVYARPHVVNGTTLVWGMTDGRTFHNIRENPHASFLFKTSLPGYIGVRVALELIRTEEVGDMLAEIKKSASEVVAPGAGMKVTHAAWFKVVETRALI